MSSMDDRKNAFENKYAKDEEMLFKITARRNKLLGHWAAEKLGKTGDDAEQYAKDVVMADFEAPGHDDVVQKILKDFTEAGVALTAKDILVETERLNPVAQQAVETEAQKA